ncbi:MAG: hypothetical protein V1772_05255, partial [Chloroflexota bacterium]
LLLPASGEYQVSELIASAPTASRPYEGQLLVELEVPAKGTRILRISTASTAETCRVALRAGWNLVALPGAPASPRLADLVAPIVGRISRLYAYDAIAQRWLAYNIQQPAAGEIQTIQPWQALWVHATEDVAWDIACTSLAQVTIPLQRGWNLVGLPLNGSVEIVQAVGGLGGRLQSVMTYDGATPAAPWRTYSPGALAGEATLTRFEMGRGYWVRMSEAATWSVAAQP